MADDYDSDVVILSDSDSDIEILSVIDHGQELQNVSSKQIVALSFIIQLSRSSLLTSTAWHLPVRFALESTGRNVTG